MAFGAIGAAIGGWVAAAGATTLGAAMAGTIASVVVGVVASAVVGAVVGGLVSAVTGGDIGQGMLYGAVGGLVIGATFGTSIGAMMGGEGAAGGAAAGGNVALETGVLSTGELVTDFAAVGTQGAVEGSTSLVVGKVGATATSWGLGEMSVAGGLKELYTGYQADKAADAAAEEAKLNREWKTSEAALDRETALATSGGGSLSVDDQSRLQMEAAEDAITQSTLDAAENIEAINQAAIDQLELTDKTAGYNLSQSKQDAANQIGINENSAASTQAALDAKTSGQAESITGSGTQQEGSFVEGYGAPSGVLRKPTEIEASL